MVMETLNQWFVYPSQTDQSGQTSEKMQQYLTPTGKFQLYACSTSAGYVQEGPNDSPFFVHLNFCLIASSNVGFDLPGALQLPQIFETLERGIMDLKGHTPGV